LDVKERAGTKGLALRVGVSLESYDWKSSLAIPFN
jgi:hypothetical protein